jgi:tRNA (guanine37-N1)-methyltransferase
MRIDIITLFPELFTSVMQHGVIRRAFLAEADHSPLVDVHFTNPRDFADGNYRRVDDRPFGGGPGMVMMAEPLARAIEAIQAERAALGLTKEWVVLFSPAGDPITHARIAALGVSNAANPGAILICGRYEGIDQRFIDRFVTEQWSLGDFVLSGGEIPAMAVLDAIARLQPGVLADDQSHRQDSFNPAIGGLLDCPHYTRPEVWRGQNVPAVLLSGNHAAIEKWRHGQREAITASRKTRSDAL